jgi:restriction system protein
MLSETPKQLPQLRAWQSEFVDTFVASSKQRSLLVATPGSGKTITALVAAQTLLRHARVDATLVISDRSLLREQWRSVAKQAGLELSDSLDTPLSDGVSTTIQALAREEASLRIEAAARSRRWLIIADEYREPATSLTRVVDSILAANTASRALYLSSTVPRANTFEADFRFDSEVVLSSSILRARSTEIQLSKYAPSLSLIRQLQRGVAAVDDLTWRQFEKLIATLVEADGYTVELMRGTKDGGVDVVAIKNLGASGYFKAVWQAKKKNLKRKVALSVVRELADTRNEFGASKGIVVTSSYLTRGALDRIERDKYILGKIDRNDLASWIQRTLFAHRY